MLTFREFYEICEGKKPATPPYAVPGTVNRDSSGTLTYTLQSYEGPKRKATKKEIKKHILDQSGRKAVEKHAKRVAKSIKKIEEDIETRRRELKQRQRDQMSAYKERVADYHASQQERKEKKSEREEMKKEIKRELKDD